MAKRGFFAEIRHQQRLAEQQRLREERARTREHAAAVRTAAKIQREAERAAVKAARASAAAQKEAEREAKRLHLEARQAEADSRNAELAEILDDLDSVLEATLDVDDFVDLEQLRVVVEHPPFPHKHLEEPLPAPPPIVAPPRPEFEEPIRPSGLGGLFGSKKHAAAVAAAHGEYQHAIQAWEQLCADVPSRQKKQDDDHAAAERTRLKRLRRVRNEYEDACKEAENEAASVNSKLDALIAGLRNGGASAIQEYVGIVLGNSVYPDRLRVEHDFAFDASTKELDLTVLIAPPEVVPKVKGYRYVKARDEVVSTDATQKSVKERYASVVTQVAVRSLHEVFEADREGHIQTIALTVATEARDPATGRQRRIALAAVGAEREVFLEFDLSNVVPAATLQHLNASVSKNPYDLVEIDGTAGVRG